MEKPPSNAVLTDEGRLNFSGDGVSPHFQNSK
jgi:hypothetical protein